MKAIIGVFEVRDDIKTAVHRLREAGFTEDDLALITSYQAEEVRDVLDEEPEKTAVSGALVGSGIGATLGLLGGIALLPIPGIGPMLASGVMATASGGVLGGYLGSLYATHAEEIPEHELKEVLSKHNVILVVRIKDSNEEKARAILSQSGGSYLKTHEVSPEALAKLAN